MEYNQKKLNYIMKIIISEFFWNEGRELSDTDIGIISVVKEHYADTINFLQDKETLLDPVIDEIIRIIAKKVYERL